MSIADIEEKFCIPKLQNVIKFVILQSCQEKLNGNLFQSPFFFYTRLLKILKKIYYTTFKTDAILGLDYRENKLFSDGIKLHQSPARYKNYAIFKATINKYRAFRDINEGNLINIILF